ncbi:UDP-glucosyltransferase 2-like [Daktulosphaira vitifoliae]|uniref:UDP-glucosyltransferase 2-like n=1 Tax=Daktulosphaira vitifoliae TaxID=58002 RepID=UPI0021AA4D97|nr:UDP-glucosyltransferase 2-like [Daktulosphaira vitifoliae]
MQIKASLFFSTYLLLNWSFRCSYGAMILALAPVASTSHWNVIDAVLQTLVARGHNVTVITPFVKKYPITNYTEILIPKGKESAISMHWNYVMNECSMGNSLPILNERHQNTCKFLFGLEEFWRTIRTIKFDLFITEWLASSCDSYVSYHLQIPQIVIATSHVHTWYLDTFASHLNPAYVSTFHVSFAMPMNFMQRFKNFVDYLYSHIVFRWVDRDAIDIGRKYFGPNVPDANTLMKDTSLVFTNGHFTVDLPKPLLPNFIDIGGIHLKPAKSLSEDVKNFIDGSTNGVIYFTFGSTIKMDTAPLHLQKSFIEALAEIPYRVLWKYESSNIDHLPNNVMVRKWFSQRDILAHKKVDLFISHGGISGIYEAIDSGVPVLGIPVFFDQSRNIANIVHWGAGLMLDHNTLTKDILVNTINEMMQNKKRYKENATNLSQRFKDRPRTPKEDVVYWSEYVIKHKGASHLKSTALNLSLLEYLLLDIITLIVLVLLVIIYLFYFILKLVTRSMCTCFKQKRD